MNLPESAARTCASRRWFLLSQNRTSIRCLRSEGPSQKIESVFSASPETIRREPREFDLLKAGVGGSTPSLATTFSKHLFGIRS
jgi:hypothetical protein